MAKLSIVDKLTLAANDLSISGKQTFTAEDLVVKAWEIFPDAFGLKGHADEEGWPLYPDSNRVFAEIMGSKPIRKRGIIEKVGSKTYQLTHTGKEFANLLKSRKLSDVPKKLTVGRDVEKEFNRLFSSKAFEKHSSDIIDDINFHDACSFWRISPNSNAMLLESRLQHILTTIDSLKPYFAKKGASIVHGGDILTKEHLNKLIATNNYLLQKFEEELDVIKRRKDERKYD